MDASQWAQGINGSKVGGGGGVGIDQKRPRPQKEKAVNCPRCNSINTKFCYYNNYSLSQPRYFCKTCRRYWTEGGTLRSVPVGGGSRKNKKSSSSSSSSSSSLVAASKKEHVPDLNPISFPLSDNNNNNSSSSASQKGQDLNLAYGYNSNLMLNPSNLSAMAPKGLMSCFMPMAAGNGGNGNNGNSNNSIFSSGFPSNSQELMKPTSLNFSLDGFGNINGYGNVQLGIDQEGSAKMFFPLEDLKLQQVSTSHDDDDDHHHHHQQQFDQTRVHGSEPSVGYWSGMLGGSGSW